MNSDIRLSTDFPMHPKTIKLRRKLGAQGVFSLISLWCFAAKHKPSGVLDSMDEEEIAIAAIWPDDASTFVCTLVELRWLDVDTSHTKTYHLHKWIDRNGYAASAPDRSDKARFSRLARSAPAIHAKLKSEGVEAVTAEEYRKLTAPTRTNRERTIEQNECEAYIESNYETYNESFTERTAPSPSPSPSPTNSYICPEPESPDSGPPVVEIVLNDKSLHPVYQDQVDEWQELFPSADVVGELRKMSAWAKANPAKRKTSRGIDRFIVAWLSKEQDNGGRKKAGVADVHPINPKWSTKVAL